MRFIVEVPATFELAVEASSHQQAKDFADVELSRVLGLMGEQSVTDSPQQCISLYTKIAGLRRVTAVGNKRAFANGARRAA